MSTNFTHTNLALDKVGDLIDCDRLAADIDEPLRVSAPLNFRAAHELCERKADLNDCYAYHALWQYLRLAGIARALRVDGPLYVDAAERFARAGRLDRVLISGTADYSMLAHLAHGAARAGRAVAFDVLDRCDTTLNINRWYADQRGLQVRIIKDDVLAFQPDRQYDLICSHSFLFWHAPSDRPRLFQRWQSWLVPGGHLCFSNRVSPQAIPFDPVERTDRMAHMAEEALRRLRALEVPLPCAEAEFIALVDKFGKRRQESLPGLPLELIERWITDAGLALDLAIRVADVLPGPEDKTIISGQPAGRPRTWFQVRR
jgi:SAM-dependent methyltransferase